jgi:hypothetical protein
VDVRTQPIEVSFQHFLSLVPMFEWPLDGPFTRNEIPLIHRVKKPASTKPGLEFSFTFAYGSHGYLSLKSIFPGTIQHYLRQAINQATRGKLTQKKQVNLRAIVTAGTKGIRVAINPLQCRLVLTEVPAFASHYSQPVLINLFALSLHTRLKRAMNPHCAFRATSIYFHNDTSLEKCHSLTTLIASFY